MVAIGTKDVVLKKHAKTAIAYQNVAVTAIIYGKDSPNDLPYLELLTL